MQEKKLINKIKCPQCGYSKDIRKDIVDNKLIYYRCKDCGFQWDKGEYK